MSCCGVCGGQNNEQTDKQKENAEKEQTSAPKSSDQESTQAQKNEPKS
jgi:formate dehydrogenase assembly factor FdhD